VVGNLTKLGGVRGAVSQYRNMLKLNPSDNRAPVKIDQRPRVARLRLEQIERLLVSRAVTGSSLSRVLCLFGLARPGEGWRASRTPGPLNNRPPRVRPLPPGAGPPAP